MTVTATRHVVVTGAGGFIGRKLVAALLAADDMADCRFTLLDLKADGIAHDPRARAIEGDFGDPETLARAIDGRADIVLHLAGILGGTAEAHYDLSRRINVDATLTLFEAVRDAARPPRVVFASSIAVFGPDLPDRVDDDTLPQPTMTYGAQKRMMEVALEQFSARGWIDGLAIRLPGIVARPDADARLKSAFLNTMFHDYAAGRDIVLPVSGDGTTWLISVPACVAAFLHAARLPAGSAGGRRAFTLPAQCVRIADVIAALGRRFPDSGSRVSYAPDQILEAQFARQPPLTTAIADRLGFRHDGTIDRLVDRAVR
ncbi:MAG: NAD-dependent epimerase/dehydratase family protein [Sphingomonas fennica]